MSALSLNGSTFASSRLELHQAGALPKAKRLVAVKQEEERLAVKSGDVKTNFTSLDQLWSDHGPLAASFEFELSAPPSASRSLRVARHVDTKSTADVLSQAPTPVKTSAAKGGGACP